MEDIYSLGLFVHRASIALAKALNAALVEAGIDLPHSQFIVLRALYYRDGQSQLNIAKLLSKDTAAIKRTIDCLCEKGLVERQTVRAMKNSIQITDKGRDTIPAALDIAQKIINKAFGEVSDMQRDKILETLDYIYKNLQKK